MQGVESEFELLYVALHQALRLAPSHLDRPPTLQADGLLAAFWSPAAAWTRYETAPRADRPWNPHLPGRRPRPPEVPLVGAPRKLSGQGRLAHAGITFAKHNGTADCAGFCQPTLQIGEPRPRPTNTSRSIQDISRPAA